MNLSDDTLKEQAERVLKAIETRAAEAEKTDDAELNSFETTYRTIHKKILTQKQTRKNLQAAQVRIDYYYYYYYYYCYIALGNNS